MNFRPQFPPEQEPSAWRAAPATYVFAAGLELRALEKAVAVFVILEVLVLIQVSCGGGVYPKPWMR